MQLHNEFLFFQEICCLRVHDMSPEIVKDLRGLKKKKFFREFLRDCLQVCVRRLAKESYNERVHRIGGKRRPPPGDPSVRPHTGFTTAINSQKEHHGQVTCISFPSAAMVVPDGEWGAVGRDAHAVIDEAKAAGVYVFGGGISTKTYRPYSSLLTARLQWAAILGRPRWMAA